MHLVHQVLRSVSRAIDTRWTLSHAGTMEESQRQKLETLVVHHATDLSKGYYLKSAINGRYPNTGFFMLDPFEAPESIPHGDYQIFFTRSLASEIPVPIAGPVPVISLGLPATAAPMARAATKEQPVTARLEPRQWWMDDPNYAKNRLELEAERFAHEMQENRMLVGRQIRISAENAEYIVMNRAMRHDLTQAYQLQYEQQRAHLQLIGEYQARLAEATGVRPTEKQAGPSWFSPEFLMAGTSLLKMLVGKEKSDDSVDATILDAKKEELLKARDKAKAKLKKLEKKKAKAKPPAKKPVNKRQASPAKRKVKGHLTKGDKR